MKFKVKLIGLKEGLSPVHAVAVSTGVKEYVDLSWMMLSADKSGITAQANNGYVAITSRIAEQKELEYESEAVSTAPISVKSEDLVNALTAFDPQESVVFELKGNELVITAVSDSERLMTIPTAVRLISMPTPATKAVQELKIKKEALLKGMEKVLFALGWEKYRPEFLYWVLRYDKKVIRFSCGDGGRFAVYEITGDGVVEADEKMDILMFREQTRDILPKILPMVSADYVTIKVANGKVDGSVSDQMIVNVGPVTMVMVGHDPGVKWPNETKFIDRKSPVRFTTSINEWNLAVSGTMATYNEAVRSANKEHNVVLEIDFSKKMIHAKTAASMKSIGKVKISDVVLDESFTDKNLAIIATSSFFDEIKKHAEKNDWLQFEIVNSTSVVIVRYYASEKVSNGKLVKANQTSGEAEQYCIFFGPKASK